MIKWKSFDEKKWRTKNEKNKLEQKNRRGKNSFDGDILKGDSSQVDYRRMTEKKGQFNYYAEKFRQLNWNWNKKICAWTMHSTIGC